MVELTHGGVWLKWSSLNRRDRNWALLSFATAGLAAVPIGVVASAWGYRMGFLLGSGGSEPNDIHAARLIGSDLYAYGMLAATVLAIVSALAWWRFSRNQDEMFNRIQNYAIAQAGAWTFAFAFVWWLLWLGGWLGPLSLTSLVFLGTVLLFIFWIYAVRRWA